MQAQFDKASVDVQTFSAAMCLVTASSPYGSTGSDEAVYNHSGKQKTTLYKTRGIPPYN